MREIIILRKIGAYKMGVLDKFLDIMKLSDEDYEDDDFFGDDYDDDFEEKPKKQRTPKKKEPVYGDTLI